MLQTMTDGADPTTNLIIKSFEQRCSQRLPKTYRDFLLTSNGGRPTLPSFPISGMTLNPAGNIQFFFGLNFEKWPVYDLSKTFDLFQAGIPAGPRPRPVARVTPRGLVH